MFMKKAYCLRLPSKIWQYIIKKVQIGMLNKTQKKPLKKQILSHKQQKWQPQILDFPRNLESYLEYRKTDNELFISFWVSPNEIWTFHNVYK